MIKRQKAILEAIVKEYVKTARPVGSSSLVKKYNFDLSSATIRKEMLELEKKKLIFQPHFSAGRVPTDRGWRYFVDYLMKEKKLTSREKEVLDKKFSSLKKQIKECNEIARMCVKILANASHCLSISSFFSLGEVKRDGMARLLLEPEFKDTGLIYEVISALDSLEDNLEQAAEEIEDNGINIFIGRENPLFKIKECSMVASRVKFSSERGFVAVLGPKRMKYARNISLIDYISEMLEKL